MRKEDFKMIWKKISVVFGIVFFAFFVSLFLSQTVFNLTGESILDLNNLENSNSNEERIVDNIVERKGICIDSDGGINYDEKGTTKFCDGDGVCRAEEDYCSARRINEWYCEDGKLAIEKFYTCPETCYQGACGEIKKYGGGGSPLNEGDSSAASTSSSQSYIWNESLSFFRIDLKNGDNVLFNINESEYKLILNNLLVDSAYISIGNENSNLFVSETKTFDLNTDNVSDVSVKLKSINILNQEASFDLTRI